VILLILFPPKGRIYDYRIIPGNQQSEVAGFGKPTFARTIIAGNSITVLAQVGKPTKFIFTEK
jgi:hypothetical protein